MELVEDPGWDEESEDKVLAAEEVLPRGKGLTSVIGTINGMQTRILIDTCSTTEILSENFVLMGITLILLGTLQSTVSP